MKMTHAVRKESIARSFGEKSTVSRLEFVNSQLASTCEKKMQE